MEDVMALYFDGQSYLSFFELNYFIYEVWKTVHNEIKRGFKTEISLNLDKEILFIYDLFWFLTKKYVKQK